MVHEFDGHIQLSEGELSVKPATEALSPTHRRRAAAALQGKEVGFEAVFCEVAGSASRQVAPDRRQCFLLPWLLQRGGIVWGGWADPLADGSTSRPSGRTRTRAHEQGANRLGRPNARVLGRQSFQTGRGNRWIDTVAPLGDLNQNEDRPVTGNRSRRLLRLGC